MANTEYLLNDVVTKSGSAYICIEAHTASAESEPGVGASWETYWSLLASKGDTGAAGAAGADGATGPAGPGVPTGGTTGQVLKKKSNTDYDTEFGDLVAVSVTTKGDLQTHSGSTPTRLPVGTDGQVLESRASETTGLKWVNHAGSNSFVTNEVPSGTVDGSNAAFTLANTPVTGSEEITLDGLKLTPGVGNDYTISGATITFLTAPLAGSNILVSYQQSVTTSGNADTLDGLHSTSFTDPLMSGWFPVADSWAYASADAPTFVITVPSGAASKYSAGMRIKLTQTTVKYFIITAVADTTLTVYGGTDYTLVDAAISGIYISSFKAPLGFPLNPAKWTVEVTNAESSEMYRQNPSANTIYEMSSNGADGGTKLATLAVPIGAWDVSVQGCFYALSNSSQTIAKYAFALSTSNSSISDADMVIYGGSQGATSAQRAITTAHIQKNIVTATKATYYLIGSTPNSGIDYLSVNTAGKKLIMRAVCAYL